MKMLILIVMPIVALVAQGELNVYELIRNAEDEEREFSKKHARLTVANFVIYHDQCAPTAGEFYEMGESYLRILQVFSDGILVWPTENIVADMPRNTWTPVFIKMQDTRGLRAEENPPWGVVKATGTRASYTSMLGRHNTVDILAMLSATEANAWKAKVDNAQTEDSRTRMQNQQTYRKEFTAKLFSSLEFDISKRIMVDKVVAPYATQIKFEVRHFAWGEFRRKCETRDWLGALNACYDILADNGTLTSHYKEYPELSRISQVFLGIKTKIFHGNSVWQLPVEVKCGILRISNRREWIIRDMGMGMGNDSIMKCDLQKIKTSFLPFEAAYISWGLGRIAFEDETIFIGDEMFLVQLADALRTHVATTEELGMYMDEMAADWNNAIDREFREKVHSLGAKERSLQGLTEFHKKMRQLNMDAREINGDYKARRISLEDHNLRMQEINKKFNALISSNFFPLRDPGAIEKAKQERQADMERERQESKKEQDRFTNEIFKRVAAMSFSVADHIIVQKALIPYIHSATVTERDWEEMMLMHKRGDYMELLKAVAKRNKMPMDEAKKEDVEKVVKKLESMSFHVQVELTHKMRLEWGILQPRDESVNDVRLCEIRNLGPSHGEPTIFLSFEVGNVNPILLYRNGESMRESLRSVGYFEEGDVSANRRVSLGKISAEEGKVLARRQAESYKRRIYEWLNTTPINLKQDPSNMIAHTTPRNIDLLTRDSSSKYEESDADIQNKALVAQQDKLQFKKVWQTVQPENPNATKVEQNLSRLKCGMENDVLAKIYDKYSDDKCKDVLNHLVSEMKSARSLKTADERMVARKNLLEKYKGIFLTGLGQRMDKIIGADAHHGQSVSPRNGGRPVATSASVAYQKCPDCDGTKSIKEESACDQCNGQGQIEKVKLGLNGTSRRVISKCANCNGTGVATKKTPCATCKGKGKIRVK